MHLTLYVPSQSLSSAPLRLQQLPQQLIEMFHDEPCLFIQAQTLEGGAEVTAHRDALPHGVCMCWPELTTIIANITTTTTTTINNRQPTTNNQQPTTITPRAT